MDKKMRGLVDPFSLGFVIAILGSLVVYAANGGDDESVIQSLEPLPEQEQIVMNNNQPS